MRRVLAGEHKKWGATLLKSFSRTLIGGRAGFDYPLMNLETNLELDMSGSSTTWRSFADGSATSKQSVLIHQEAAFIVHLDALLVDAQAGKVWQQKG
jgi:hypothetical protein